MQFYLFFSEIFSSVLISVQTHAGQGLSVFYFIIKNEWFIEATEADEELKCQQEEILTETNSHSARLFVW